MKFVTKSMLFQANKIKLRDSERSISEFLNGSSYFFLLINSFFFEFLIACNENNPKN